MRGAPSKRKRPRKGKIAPSGYKTTIFFVWDRDSHSTVIGGVLLDRSDEDTHVPEILEFGGDELIWVGFGKTLKQVMAHYEARPHMRPALRAALGKLSDYMTDCIMDEATGTVSINL